jgi:hypothetical protein
MPTALARGVHDDTPVRNDVCITSGFLRAGGGGNGYS